MYSPSTPARAATVRGTGTRTSFLGLSSIVSHLALSVSRRGGWLLASRTRQAERQRGDYAFHVFLQHEALSDRRRDDPIPEALGQLSQRPPAGAVRRGHQLEVEGL